MGKIGLWDKRNEFLLKDVTAIELALDSALRKQLLDLLQGFGYQMTGSGAMVVATGPENRLMVTAADMGSLGIRRVTFSLQRSVAGEMRQSFGRSSLLVSPRDEAVWSF